jgi:dTDP-4-dehydrorhamnose reductase
MRQKQRILLLGSTGYLGRTLTTQLQTISQSIPTHRTKAYFADSQRYDFWTDDVLPGSEHHQIDTVVIAANMAYEAADPTCEFSIYKQQAERLIKRCQQCRVIYISSDGLFDGQKGSYTESDTLPTKKAWEILPM